MFVKFLALLVGLFLGLMAATQFVAWAFNDAPALGARWTIGDVALYPPTAFIAWRNEFGELHPKEFKAALGIMLAGILIGAALASSLGGSHDTARDRRRRRGWGSWIEAWRSGMLGREGCVVGKLGGRVITTKDLRPTLVTGGTRSGKGRGHVVPTLLNWTDSVLVHDPKGELWRLTAGWRAKFSHALYFNPRDRHSACFNPLAEIEHGANEVTQVQRLVAILADPSGRVQDEAIWDKAGAEIVEAVMLDTCYTAKSGEKNLLTVKRRLADLDATAAQMLKTLHRAGSDGKPETHPFIRDAATGYVSMHDRFRTSVQGTARSYFKWLAGGDIERALSRSDFRLGDLMCAEAPMSLYVQVSAADSVALRPLVRMMFYAASQALTLDEHKDTIGRPKRRQLLMVMDEFPLLGRLDFFEKSLRLMSSYGLKAMFVAQSLNDIAETYGPYNGILDNCSIYTAFAALDPMTQDKVSRLTGAVTETRTTLSAPQGAFSLGRSSRAVAEQDRPLLEPGEVRGLPDDDQIVFVAGRRPFRMKKVRYDQQQPFKQRAEFPAPDQSQLVDTPGRPPHPWDYVSALGVDDEVELPLFKEQRGAMAERDQAEAAERVQSALEVSDKILKGLKAKRRKKP
ncbi:MAG: conjugal transfer protein TraG [Proteobacteria bacterium HN_bin10]|nr:MAG: conjugal transfer protein TraG [Proteobacteria bacterium HN_bin10]